MKATILGEAITKIIWAYIFFHLNINLGPINILPSWAGYALLLLALPVIAEEEPSANLLVPLGKMLVGLDLLSWVNTSFLGNVMNLEFVMIFESVISLYFHFQLLTNLATIAGKYRCSQEKRLLTLRTAHTLLLTFLSVVTMFQVNEIVTYIFYGMVIVGLAITIWIGCVLASLKKELPDNMILYKEVSV